MALPAILVPAVAAGLGLSLGYAIGRRSRRSRKVKVTVKPPPIVPEEPVMCPEGFGWDTYAQECRPFAEEPMIGEEAPIIEEEEDESPFIPQATPLGEEQEGPFIPQAVPLGEEQEGPFIPQATPLGEENGLGESGPPPMQFAMVAGRRRRQGGPHGRAPRSRFVR